MTEMTGTPGATTVPRRMGRLWRGWPSWVGYAAAAWSLAYGLLGLFWTLGGGGFPFGEGDLPDARQESALGGVQQATAAPVIAALGLAGALAALIMTRGRARGVGRTALLVAAWGVAVGLLVVVADGRVLMLLGYAPVLPVIFLSQALTGWPPLTMAEVFPWQTVNMLIIVAGGMLWAGAALTFQRRTAHACQHCGRGGHQPAWMAPQAAARWGKIAALVAFAAPFGYSVTRWAWVFNIPLGMSAEEVRVLREIGAVWAGAWLATFGAAGGILTLGLYQRWGEVFPRWIPRLAGRVVPVWFAVVPATVVTVALASGGMTALRISDFSDLGVWLAEPYSIWPLWAVTLGVATLGYYLRRRGRCRHCQRA